MLTYPRQLGYPMWKGLAGTHKYDYPLIVLGRPGGSDESEIWVDDDLHRRTC